MNGAIADLLKPLAEFAEPLVYRLAAYFMTSLLDDPAMLALAFC
jgi:hypothetical protein